MKAVGHYLEKNGQRMSDIFTASSREGEIQATSLHSFLQEIFRIQEIRFLKQGRDYFKDDDNQAHTEKIIEQYYKTTPDGKAAKFYLYRITFSLEEIQEYLEYWISTDKAVTVEYPAFLKSTQHQLQGSNLTQPNGVAIEELRESTIIDNQFIHEQQKIPIIREAYQKEIHNLEEMLAQSTHSPQQSLEINNKIEQYKNKLEQLEPKKSEIKLTKKLSEKQKLPSPPKSKTETSRTKKEINFKLLFEFYARQNHLTGVKASFQRIQHESQTINYQKLVHFLKEYEIFPQKPKDQKRLHNLYVRECSSTRDLHYHQFMQLLEKLPDILYESPESSEERKQLMLCKIQTKNEKNKLLHNPFHSLEKNDFRIDSQNLKYSFKLKPLQGKLEEEVNHELEARRKQKQQAKVQHTKQKEQKHLQKLKKLMSIDPYHPLVVKNADLLQKRSISVMMEPIANLDNMEKFRDVNFDMKAQFGISDFEQDPLKQISRRYDANKRAQVLQRQESQRMSVLMNGLIERSDAKIQKFSLSPKKRQISSKLN